MKYDQKFVTRTFYINRCKDIEFYYDFLMNLPGDVQNTVTGPSRRVAIYQPGPGKDGSFEVKTLIKI